MLNCYSNIILETMCKQMKNSKLRLFLLETLETISLR